jgi:hypothetical protein
MGGCVSQTRMIEPAERRQYFDDFTKRFVRNGPREAVTIEVLEGEIGDQAEVTNAALYGITYDPHTDELDIALETGDHRVFNPADLWVVEESDGFISALQLARSDGGREVVSLKRDTELRLD